MTNAGGDLAAVAADLGRLLEAGATAADGRIRVEDLLSAAAAVCGEAILAAAGEVNPVEHDLTPGSAVLSHRVNQILVRDAPSWEEAGRSVFGIIRAEALASGYAAGEFPPISEPIERYVAGLAQADSKAEWGRVSLSVADDHRPRFEPLRSAYELRRPVRRLLEDRHVPTGDWPTVCAEAIGIELGRVAGAIDHGVAVRLVLETVNGMAKMAPMTERHMREAGARAEQGGG